MYGTGTRSYNNSTEARENKRQQKEATERHLEKPRTEILLDANWLMCSCDGRPHKHQAHQMRELINYRPWYRYEYMEKRGMFL